MELTSYLGYMCSEADQLHLPMRVAALGTKILSTGETDRASGKIKNFVELLWITAGSGEVSLYEQNFLLNKNDVFYYLPGEDHFLRGISENWEIKWFCFDGALAAAIMLSFNYPRVQHASVPCPLELFNEILQNMSSPSPIERGILIGKMMMVLAMANGSQPAQKHEIPLIDQTLHFIENNLFNPSLNITMIVDYLKISRSKLMKCFSKEMQTSLGSYIRSMRLKRGTDLLRSTSLPVGEIAKQCGYSSLPTFSKLIHRATGMSPNDFRRKISIK